MAKEKELVAGVDFEWVQSKGSNARTRRIFGKKEKAERAAAANAPAKPAARPAKPASRAESAPPARPAKPKSRAESAPPARPARVSSMAEGKRVGENLTAAQRAARKAKAAADYARQQALLARGQAGREQPNNRTNSPAKPPATRMGVLRRGSGGGGIGNAGRGPKRK
jgi:hypothetical protein